MAASDAHRGRPRVWRCCCCLASLGPPLALLLPYSWHRRAQQVRAAAAEVMLRGGVKSFPRISCNEAERLFERHVLEQRPLLIAGCEHLLRSHVPRTWEEAATMWHDFAHANRRSRLAFSALARHFPDNINVWVPQDRLGDQIATPAFWAAGGSKAVPQAAGPLEAHPHIAKYVVSHRGAFFATHRDMYRENLEMIITGEKLVVMFPPTPQNYLRAGPRVMFNASSSRDTQSAGYPDLRQLGAMERLHVGVVRAGEMVYVPSDWFHFFMPTARAPETQLAYCWRRTSEAAQAGGCERLEARLGRLLHELAPEALSSPQLPAAAAALREEWRAADRSACPYLPGLAEQLMERRAWPEALRARLRREVLLSDSPD